MFDVMIEGLEYTPIQQDQLAVDTKQYSGKAYFWNYKYRFWMRGDAHGNGYKGLPIEHARKIIHRLFLAEGFDLAGDTEQHDEIINLVFGMNEYQQERN